MAEYERSGVPLQIIFNGVSVYVIYATKFYLLITTKHFCIPISDISRLTLGYMDIP